MLSVYGKNEWLTVLASGLMFTIVAGIFGLWWVVALLIVATIALLSFFRDPERRVPTQRGAVVAPADGVVSSVHELDHFEPLNGPVVCVRIFLSVLDVHVNRSPCHCTVKSITYKPGEHRNALNPESAEDNESNLIVLVHPIRRYPVAAVRQVAGMLARTIVCAVREEQVLQRGQRMGMIKLGSTTELYLPKGLKPRLNIQQGQKVKGGLTVLAYMSTKESDADDHTLAAKITATNPTDAIYQAKSAHPHPHSPPQPSNPHPQTPETQAAGSSPLESELPEPDPAEHEGQDIAAEQTVSASEPTKPDAEPKREQNLHDDSSPKSLFDNT